MESSGELIAGSFQPQSLVRSLLERRLEGLPPDFEPLTKAKDSRFGLTLTGKTISGTVRIPFPDAAAAAAGEATVREVIELTNTTLVKAKNERDIRQIQPAVQVMDDVTASITAADVKVDGPTIVVTFKFDIAADMEKRIAQIAAEARSAAVRSTADNNLKQIGLALQNHNDINRALPENIYSKDGKTPLLSWRVQILPFMEEEQLYRQFKLDEPWDSEHNKKLLPLIPRNYMHPVMKTDVVGGTFHQSFVGKPDHKLHPRLIEGKITKMTIQGFANGLPGNTITVAEAATAVPWTKPEDIAFDPDGPRPAVAKCWPKDSFLAMFGDGSVKLMAGDTKDEELKRMIIVDDRRGNLNRK
jgi:hypothetical protein